MRYPGITRTGCYRGISPWYFVQISITQVTEVSPTKLDLCQPVVFPTEKNDRLILVGITLLDLCHPWITASSGYPGVSLKFLSKFGITWDNLGYIPFSNFVSGVYRDIPIFVEISKAILVFIILRV